MKIIICLKQILDPEISPRDFRIDQQRLEAVRGSANLVTNIFCENALETALQLRDRDGGEITALTFGPPEAEESLRKALALRVDHAYRVNNPGIPHCGSAAAAQALAAAIKKLAKYDLIVLGREAGDWGEGQTAGFVAELLSLPCVTFVDQIEAENPGVRLQRQTEFGREELSAGLPVVVSITNNEANVPRVPKTRDIMLAHRKELVTWTLHDIGLTEESVRQAAAATQVVELYIPQKTTCCEFISGGTLDDRVERFARKVSDIVRTV